LRIPETTAVLWERTFFPLTLALFDGVHCKNLAQGRKYLPPLVGPFGSASKKLTWLITKKIVEIASGLVSLEKQVVISTGGKVVFSLPHFVAQSPCLEVFVNCIYSIVCPTTCDTVETLQLIPAPSPHHETPRKGREEGNPGIGEGQGGSGVICSWLILVQVAIL